MMLSSRNQTYSYIVGGMSVLFVVAFGLFALHISLLQRTTYRLPLETNADRQSSNEDDWMTPLFSLYVPSFAEQLQPESGDMIIESNIESKMERYLASVSKVNNAVTMDWIDFLNKTLDPLNDKSLYVFRVSSPSVFPIIHRSLDLTNADVIGNPTPDIGIHSLMCWKRGCAIEIGRPGVKGGRRAIEQKWESSDFYRFTQETRSDKTGPRHHYHTLYSKYLPPKYGSNLPLLEIGLGCGQKTGNNAMQYAGVGDRTTVYGSAVIWTRLFGNVNFVEFDPDCAERWIPQLTAMNVTVFVGSQSDIHFLEQLKYAPKFESGFEIIIDDGGHRNDQILASLYSLWPQIRTHGGLYFVEDYGESQYSYPHFGDSQPISKIGGEILKPGTAQFHFKMMTDSLFCHLRSDNHSCDDLKLQMIECQKDICMFRKK